MLNLGNLRPYLQEASDQTVFRNVLEAVKETITELHINDNAITDEAFQSCILKPLSEMPRLKHLNLAKNGQLSKVSTVGVLARMAERWQEERENGAEGPLPLERLNMYGTYLADDGLAEMLPLLASPAFGRFKSLSIVATKLTPACTGPFVQFIGEQFPDNRRLFIDLRLQNIRKIDRKSEIDPVKEFR